MSMNAKVGYIFLCSNGTEDECFQRMLFGSTLRYKSSTQNIQVNDVLFLYNYTSQKLHGIYSAESTPQENIIPNAWGGKYPWQVKIKMVEEYDPISKVILEQLVPFNNSFPIVNLSEEQVNKLTELFQTNTFVPKEEKDFRDKFPAKIRTEDGHLVRSRAEAEIDNWLFHQRIVHAYERKLPVEEKLYCDFYIPINGTTDKVYVEYWGLQDANYQTRKEKKIELYKKYNLKLIELTVSDADVLDDILPQKIRVYIPDQIFL